MILWCLCLKARVTREEDRAEIRWRLWLRVNVVLVGHSDGGDADSWGDPAYLYGLRLKSVCSVALCFEIQ